MAYEFKLPDIGEGVVEGEIVRWLVAEGDLVRQDQPMVEIMTDKATVEIPAPRPGRVLKRMYAEGEVCPVGKVLIAIDESGDPGPDGLTAAPAPGSQAPAPERPDRQPPAAASPAAAGGGASAASAVSAASAASAEAVLATPATRKLARDLGVDLTGVAGSGPSGRITNEDVRAAQGGADREVPDRAGGPPREGASNGRGVTARTPDVRIPFRGLRKKIAENMLRSKREAAHFTYVEEVDCSELVGLREKANLRLGPQGLKLSFLPFIVKATVEALRRFPQLNATLDEKASEVVQRHEYHIGVAAQTSDGLVVPVVRHADRLSILDLAREIERLAAVTRAGKASREELSGSTFTVTSLGALGGLLATPIINHPEVAILGVHKIAKRPAVIEDKIVIRDMMNLSVSVDHRLVDGYDAARFMAEIKESLESPGLLFLESI